MVQTSAGLLHGGWLRFNVHSEMYLLRVSAFGFSFCFFA